MPIAPMSKTEAAEWITAAIRAYLRDSPLNRMPGKPGEPIFDEPLVQFAAGDDPLFAEYKKIIDPQHLTPREAMAQALSRNPAELPPLAVISWILPIQEKTRRANRRSVRFPSRRWALTRTFGEELNEQLHDHVARLLTEAGYLAVAPTRQKYFRIEYQEEGPVGYFSNWSQRHVAYAAGLGTFSLSDGLITERGIAHRCGSVVTSLPLPVSLRTATGPYANCLFRARGTCKTCVRRCPAGAITEQGHDKAKCRAYVYGKTRPLIKRYGAKAPGCGLCQTKTPCEFRNPTRDKAAK